MVRQAGVTPMNSVDDGAEAILNLATGPTVAKRSGLISTDCAKRVPIPRPMTPPHAND